MADNVAVTPGAGATIATDDVAGVQYQRVKVDGGGDGAATPILAGGGVEASALRVTIASDSTGVLSVDDNGSTLSIDDGGGAITVDGTVTANLAAGTNYAGKVRLTDGTTDAEVVALAGYNAQAVAIVDGSGNQITSFGGGSQYAEDAAHVSGDIGTMALSVRKDTAAATSGTDGDYQPLITDANGRLHSAAVCTGNVASDAADSGNPIKVGGIARPYGGRIAVASGDRVDAQTDLYGNWRVALNKPDWNQVGVYYWHSGTNTISASADGAASAGGGLLWILNPTGSGIKVRIRKIVFRSQLGSALLTPTSPRFTIEKSTYTGTPSGAGITPVKRRSGDSSASGLVKTASTGMTIAASTVVGAFFPIAAASAVAYTTPVIDVWQPEDEEGFELAELDLLVIRQADAGTTSDTRRLFIDVVTEEGAT